MNRHVVPKDELYIQSILVPVYGPKGDPVIEPVPPV
jgi:hypothetical protein